MASSIGPIAKRASELTRSRIEQYFRRLADGETASKRDLAISAGLVRDFIKGSPELAVALMSFASELSKKAKDENLQQVEFLLKLVKDPRLQEQILREGGKTQRTEIREIHKTVRVLGSFVIGGIASVLTAVVLRPQPPQRRRWWER